MLAVGRSRLAANSGLSLPKLSAIVARAIARSGPLSSGAANAINSQATFAPFVKANLPLLTNLVLREYATAAKKKTATKKKTTTATKKKVAPVKKKTAAKKPAPKRRAVAKKTGTRRTSATKKPVKKEKPAPKKKVVKKKAGVKKPGIKAQYQKALMNAPSKRASPYNLFFTDSVKSAAPGTKLSDWAKDISQRWKTLSEAEKKIWYDRSVEETIKKKAAYAEWLAKQNPVDIAAANNARGRIRAYRTEKKMKGSGSDTKIKDDRLVKRPRNAWIFYLKENFNHPELGDLEAKLKMVKLSEMFKEASEAEKKKYADLATKDTARFKAEKADFDKKYKH